MGQCKRKKTEPDVLMLSRAFFESPYWRDKRRFSCAEALLDMIAGARYNPTLEPISVLGRWKKIRLRPGEIVGSIRFLAERWQWSRRKVERFLGQLIESGYVSRRIEGGIGVLCVDAMLREESVGSGETLFGTVPGTVSGTGKKSAKAYSKMGSEYRNGKSETVKGTAGGTVPVTEAGRRRDKSTIPKGIVPKGNTLSLQTSLAGRLHSQGVSMSERWVKALERAAGDDAGEFQRSVVDCLAEAGYEAEVEYAVPDRGDGKPGRVDVVVRDGAGDPIGIECDHARPRKKSIVKLERNFTRWAVLCRKAAEGVGIEPPSLTEWLAYAAEIGFENEDATAAYDHYSANGWRVGGRAPMQDWRAACRSCKRRAEQRAGAATVGRRSESVWSLKERIKAVDNEITEAVYPGGCATAATLSAEDDERVKALRKTKRRLKERLTEAQE